MLVVPVMAAVTQHIGFGVTSNLTYEPPYLFARRASTLDHLTGGRFGWNIVTGYLDECRPPQLGLAAQPEHDGRYDIADEYMDVVYKLTGRQLEDDAVLRDRANRHLRRPVQGASDPPCFGRHCWVADAIRLAEPSPQRTAPVLYQAGSSPRGREFAARHTECVFVNGPDKPTTLTVVRDIRIRAAAHGRNPADILVFLGRTVVVGRTRADAEEKFQEYHRHASIEGALAHFSSSTGIDLSRYELDEPDPLREEQCQQLGCRGDYRLSREPWTLRRIARADGPGQPQLASIVGSAEEVADELIAWVEETGADGFNLSRVVTPETLEDFVDLVVPILQERGIYKHRYESGPLRQKLFGHARLPDTHPAATHRRPALPARQSAAE